MDQTRRGPCRMVGGFRLFDILVYRRTGASLRYESLEIDDDHDSGISGSAWNIAHDGSIVSRRNPM
jgi:hypothetical protein